MIRRFGGIWTEIKLDVLRQYLNSYKKALKKKPFQKIYVDSFAGSGMVLTKDGRLLDGSAKIALDSNGFDVYVFIEKNPQCVEALTHLKREENYKDRAITIERGDANEALLKWTALLQRHQWRGVAFLDPFGMELKWQTLKSLAQTGIFDVWYLFPLSGLYRLAPRDKRRIDPSRVTLLNQILGTEEWLSEFYQESPQLKWYSDTDYVRKDVDQLEHWVYKRLCTIFPEVAPPLRLPFYGAPRFSLFFAMSNPSKRARDLGMRIAGHILKNAFLKTSQEGRG